MCGKTSGGGRASGWTELRRSIPPGVLSATVKIALSNNIYFNLD